MRASLPIFCDYITATRDLHMNDLLQNIDKLDVNIYMVPKYDGSMFNLVYINEDDVLYDIISKLDEVIIRNGIWIFGSKNTFIAKDPVLRRIRKSIIGSYDSIDNFIDLMIRYKSNLLGARRITFHFEAIDKDPTDELTIKYDKDSCNLLGYTYFNDTYKEFFLPVMTDYIISVEPIMFTKWSDTVDYYNQIYDRILAGDNYELEGWVCHIYYLKDGIKTWIPLKYKYDFYYIGHKPDSRYNVDKLKCVLEDDKYTNVRNRLFKLVEKPLLTELVTKHIDKFIDLLSVPNKMIRKDWYMFWNTNKEYDELISIIDVDISTYHKQYHDKLNRKKINLIMNLYDKNVKNEVLLEAIMNIIER